jgi:hypothetical protein
MLEIIGWIILGSFVLIVVFMAGWAGWEGRNGQNKMVTVSLEDYLLFDSEEGVDLPISHEEATSIAATLSYKELMLLRILCLVEDTGMNVRKIVSVSCGNIGLPGIWDHLAKLNSLGLIKSYGKATPKNIARRFFMPTVKGKAVEACSD